MILNNKGALALATPSAGSQIRAKLAKYHRNHQPGNLEGWKQIWNQTSHVAHIEVINL